MDEGLPSRVVLVLATSAGGIGTHVRSLVRGLRQHDRDVVVAGPEAVDDQFDLSGAGARFEPVEIATTVRPFGDARAVVRLRRIASAITDAGVIVHAHGLRAGSLTALALGATRRPPLVVTWHNAVLATGVRRTALAGLERTAARRADITLGASHDLVVRARECGSRDARLSPVAAPPMPPAKRPASEIRAELGAGDRPLVLAVGRLAPQKSYGLLLDAAAQLGRRSPSPLILIAGEGPERAYLAPRIAAERLPVQLLGHRADIPDLLAAADAVVITSRWEARALVAQEALRAGRPLIATAVGGLPDLVGDAALLVPYGDAAALAQAVASVLDDRDLAADLAAAGPRQAATWPTESDTIAAVLAIYRELTSRRRPT